MGNMPQSLDELRKVLNELFNQRTPDLDMVKALLEGYKSNPADWNKFVFSERNRYTRNLIDVGNGKFNMLALCWLEGQGSSIHDHCKADCFVKILEGQLTETRFAWPSGSESELQETSCNTYSTDQVTHISDELGLHRMENRSHSERCVSLHLYYPPFQFCHIFDQRTGHQDTVPMVFDSKFGEKTPPTLKEYKMAAENN